MDHWVCGVHLCSGRDGRTRSGTGRPGPPAHSAPRAAAHRGPAVAAAGPQIRRLACDRASLCRRYHRAANAVLVGAAMRLTAINTTGIAAASPSSEHVYGKGGWRGTSEKGVCVVSRKLLYLMFALLVSAIVALSQVA